MPRMKRKRMALIAMVTIVVGAGVVFLTTSRRLPYDPKFDTTVADPAFRSGGPVVLYDEGHLNTHAADGAYRPLADLMRNDGYDLRVTRDPLSADALAGVSVLIVALARGANDANDDAAFADAEIAVVDTWVRGGGALLLVTDHWPFGPAMESLARPFGVAMGKGLVQDLEYHDASMGDSHLVFSADNGLLRDHPIVRGRNATERISRVLTFTGQSILGPPDAVAFLALSDAATELPPTTPHVEKDGGDVRVKMEYGAAVTAAGRAQGIALEIERGRIVILGEAGMLRAERGGDGMPVGMNVAGYDNRQLALNIMRWLSGVL